MTSWIRCAWVSVVVGVFIAALSAGPATAELASTPYMGWNTYYGVGGDFNQQTITSVAESLVNTGLAQAGYRIVWLDAGWATGARGPTGQLTVSSTQWPNGLAWLTAWLHSQGLLAGIYTDAGATGCNGQGVGSLGHYQQDADTFAAWGFDAVKFDFCGAGQDGLTPQTQYTQFAQALANNSSARPMLLNVDNFWEPGQIDGTNPSLANSAYANYQWAPQIAQSWRTDTDIGFGGGRGIVFSDVLRNMDSDAAHPEAAGPGHWNDPDYLGPELGMTGPQAQAQFSMWAMLSAPLILGSDPRVLSPGAIAMLENQQVIAIDQDPLGAQATMIQQQGDGQVWVKPLSGGDVAVALLNRGDSEIPIGIGATAAGLPPTGAYQVHDLWQGTTSTTSDEIAAWVPPTSAALYRVSAIPRHTLTVALAGKGAGIVTSSPAGISCPGTCSAAFPQDVTVSLTTAPASDTAFGGWSGAGCWGKDPCDLAMGANQAVSAKFAAPTGYAGAASSTGTGVRDRLKCGGPAGLSCHFTMTLTTVERTGGGKPLAVSAAAKKKKRKARTVVVGRKTVTLRVGHAKKFTVELNKTGRQLLTRFSKLPVTFWVQLGPNRQLVTIARRRLTVKPKSTRKSTPSHSVLQAVRLDWPAL